MRLEEEKNHKLIVYSIGHQVQTSWRCSISRWSLERCWLLSQRSRLLGLLSLRGQTSTRSVQIQYTHTRADKQRETNNAKHRRRCHCRCRYLMRFADVHDAWRIDDGKDHREKVEGIPHHGGQSWTQHSLDQGIDPGHEQRTLYHTG